MAEPLGDHRGNGRAPDAPLQQEDKDGVQNDVCHRTHQRGHHARAGKALGVDEAVHPQGDQHEQIAGQIDPGVVHGIADGVGAGAEGIEQRRQEDLAQQCQRHGEDQKQGKGVAQNMLCCIQIALAPLNGAEGRAAHAGQAGKGHDDGDHRQTQAQTGQGHDKAGKAQGQDPADPVPAEP